MEDEGDGGRRSGAEASSLVSFLEAEQEEGPQKTVSVVLDRLSLRSLWNIQSKPTGGCLHP